ncbi:Restriction of telomere capping protein 1 [Dictyocoela muelleri]|nr:Restriction of telomere capping protein 1 [Dictyocoela muelleri]
MFNVVEKFSCHSPIRSCHLSEKLCIGLVDGKICVDGVFFNGHIRETNECKFLYPVNFLECKNNILLSGGSDGTVKVWDLKSSVCKSILVKKDLPAKLLATDYDDVIVLFGDTYENLKFSDYSEIIFIPDFRFT